MFSNCSLWTLCFFGFARLFDVLLQFCRKRLAKPKNPKNPKTPIWKPPKTQGKTKNNKNDKASEHYSWKTLPTKSWLHRVCCVVVWFRSNQVGIGDRTQSGTSAAVLPAWEFCLVQNHCHLQAITEKHVKREGLWQGPFCTRNTMRISKSWKHAIRNPKGNL